MGRKGGKHDKRGGGRDKKGRRVRQERRVEERGKEGSFAPTVFKSRRLRGPQAHRSVPGAPRWQKTTLAMCYVCKRCYLTIPCECSFMLNWHVYRTVLYNVFYAYGMLKES